MGTLGWQFWVTKAKVRLTGPWGTYDEAHKSLERLNGLINSSYFDYEIEQESPVPVTPKQDSKIAFAAKKVPLMMVAFKSLYGAARVFGYGRKKHGAGNYLLATLADGAGERYFGALYRHASEMQDLDGTWTKESLAACDEESGLPHIDHIIATLIMLRGILIKEKVLPMDPGAGKEPPKNV